jgi:hypothetical protein
MKGVGYCGQHMIKTISQQNGYSTHHSHCHIMAIFQILKFKILKAIL